MELLLAAGARDVNYTPIYMKKNRPACKLEVLCKEEKVSALEEVIFHQTTAIGLRKRKEVRRILPRKKETVMTPYGEVELKICTSAGETYIYPEYDSIRGLVQEKMCIRDRITSMSQSNISKILNGKVVPKIETLQKIASATHTRLVISFENFEGDD